MGETLNQNEIKNFFWSDKNEIRTRLIIET